MVWFTREATRFAARYQRLDRCQEIDMTTDVEVAKAALGSQFPALFGAREGKIAVVSPAIRANLILRDDAIRRYARVLTALHRPKARGRKAVAEERAQVYEAAKAQLRERMVMDPTNMQAPVLFHGPFEWVPNGRNEEIGKIRIMISLAGEDVEAVPAVSVKMPWLGLDAENRFVSNGEFYFFLFRPLPVAEEQDERPHIAFPINLCSKKIVQTVNGLYAPDDPNRIEIEPIESDFDKTGVRKFTFTATCLKLSRRNKEELQKIEEEGSNREPRLPKQYVLGYYMGKVVMTEPGSPLPVEFFEQKTRKNRETGEPEKYDKVVGYETGVYRYVEGPTMILVKFLGSTGTVSDEDRVRVLDVAYEADPFETLGVASPLAFEDENAVDARVAAINALTLDENPVLAMVVNTLGLTTWDADLGEQVDHIEDALRLFVPKAKEQVREARALIEGSFTFTDFQAIGKTLKGVDLNTLKESTEGEDMLTKAIEAKTGVPFDWTLGMYRSLRLWLIAKSVAAVAKLPDPPAEQAPAAAEPTKTTDPEAKRPSFKLSYKVLDARVSVDDPYAFLGITSEKATDAWHELQTLQGPDLVSVAIAVNEQLKAKGKRELDPANAGDADRLTKLVAKVREAVTEALAKVVTAV